MRLLLGTGLLAVSLVVGCATAPEGEEVAAADEALRTDPNAVVTTNDASVYLGGGYNALLDRMTSTTPCTNNVTEARAESGNLGSDFDLRAIQSKEELAKELEVDVSASFKTGGAQVDPSTKLVKSFKQSSTRATFLVRAYRSYLVTNRTQLAITDDAVGLLREGRNADFLRRCGGSYVSGIRYAAEIVALLEFSAQTVEQARQIEVEVSGGNAGVTKKVGSVRAGLRTKIEETAKKYNAQVQVRVHASGFDSAKSLDGASQLSPIQALDKLDDLRAQMNKSFDADLARDVTAYFGPGGRKVRPAMVTQSSYATLPNAPSVGGYGVIGRTLEGAERFYNTVAKVQGRMESAYTGEIAKFLQDTQNHHRYNLVGNPQLASAALLPIAERWEAAFRPSGVDPVRGPGGSFAAVAGLIERCLHAASSGDYGTCAADATPGTRQLIDAADKQLGDYARTGRIVELSASMPRLGKTVSYRNADNECINAGLRLPTRAEMKVLAPAVTALAGDLGEVWFASDAACDKPLFRSKNGQATYGCGDRPGEWLPWVADRPVMCVGQAGPIPPLPRD